MKKPLPLFVSILLLLSGCATPNPRVATTPNRAARLLGNLPADPLQWQVVTAQINSRQSTMSTLFGNDRAVAYARTHADDNFPGGSVLSLVTWNQQEDARWFGARIPSAPRSVEFLSVRSSAEGKPFYSYQLYQGTPLSLATSQESQQAQGRVSDILSMRAAVMP